MSAPTPEFSQFYYQQPLQQQIIDKTTGAPLAGGTVNYYSDPGFSVPFDVFEQNNSDPSEYINIGSSVTLSGIGTFIDGSGANYIPFLFPYILNELNVYVYNPYYIKVLDSSGAPEFTMQYWPPNNYSVPTPATDQVNTSQNIITDPQFSEVSFSQPPAGGACVYSVSGNSIINIAPGWYISSTGTGTIALQQNAVAGPLLSLEGGGSYTPSYTLTITTSGITSFILYQRILNSPNLLFGGSVAGLMLAKNLNLGALSFTMYYAPSNGTPTALFTASTDTEEAWTLLTGPSVAITSGESTDTAAAGYLDIQIIPLTVIGSFSLTTIQVQATATAGETTDIIQTSIPQQESELFYYWQPLINQMPKPSYLVGWDFALNPAQFAGASRAVSPVATGANGSYYAWDQTILFQTENSSITVSSGTYGGIVLTATTNPTQMAMIQYLDAPVIQDLLNAPICINVSALTSVEAGVDCCVSLYYTTGTLPSIPSTSFDSIVATLNSNGSVNSTNTGTNAWVQITNVNPNGQYFTISNGADYSDIQLSGWNTTLAAAVGNATYFAIVIGTVSIAAAQSITFGSVSLQSGYLPTRPAPLTYSETLIQCQRYYETSFSPGVVSTATYKNIVAGPANSVLSAGTYGCYPAGFGYQYKSCKRTSATPTFYSGQSSTVGKITAALTNTATGLVLTEVSLSDFYTALSGALGAYGFAYSGNSAGSMTPTAASSSPAAPAIYYHYLVDDRLGVV